MPRLKMELPEKKKEEGIPPVQKMGANHEKDKLQKKDGHQKEEEKHGATVQTKPDASSNTTSPQVTANLKNTAGKGDALPAKIMKEMMKGNTLAPTPGNFLDIMELTRSLKDKK